MILFYAFLSFTGGQNAGKKFFFLIEYPFPNFNSQLSAWLYTWTSYNKKVF